jgi:glycine/D-amino acid oxidase-like deaminating enzyme
MKVVIIGAGIMGAALARGVAGHGAEVCVVDSGGVAGGATGRSFGWVNASFYADAAHFALRAEGIAAYRRLVRDLALPVRFSGALCWEESGAALVRQAAELDALGYDAEIVGAEDLAWMEPAVGDLTRGLLAQAGVRVLSGCAVEGIEVAGGRVSGVRVAAGVLPADRVIVAAGIGSAALLNPLGVVLPMVHRPGVIFSTAPVASVLNHVCVAPIGEFRQLPDGRLLMPTAVAHQADESDRLGDRLDVLAAAACARLREVLPDVDVRWQEVAMALRPVPGDGLPVIGACGPEGVFAAVMHSGITLAPVVAEILGAEVMELTHDKAGLVAPYGLARFQSG